MERVINEFRVIETEDGFRIEIKGDKEKLKSFMYGFRGRKDWPHWHTHAWRGAHGPFGFPFSPWMWMRAASCCGMWDTEADEGEEGEEE